MTLLGKALLVLAAFLVLPQVFTACPAQVLILAGLACGFVGMALICDYGHETHR